MYIEAAPRVQTIKFEDSFRQLSLSNKEHSFILLILAMTGKLLRLFLQGFHLSFCSTIMSSCSLIVTLFLFSVVGLFPETPKELSVS